MRFTCWLLFVCVKGINQWEGDAPPKYLDNTTLASRVSFLNPKWNEESTAETLYKQFVKAMDLTGSEFSEAVKYIGEVCGATLVGMQFHPVTFKLTTAEDLTPCVNNTGCIHSCNDIQGGLDLGHTLATVACAFNEWNILKINFQLLADVLCLVTLWTFVVSNAVIVITDSDFDWFSTLHNIIAEQEYQRDGGITPECVFQ